MGGRLVGQITATSLLDPCPPEPVLSPTRQAFGRPARSLAPPVLQATSQSTSWSREAGARAAAVASLARSLAIALGRVVSRGSPGSPLLRSGSTQSSLVNSSPSERANRVTACGPPRLATSRLAAVLSESVTAASQSSATDISPPT